MEKASKSGEGKLQWWQLSLIGIGCIIGTGFFLGSSIAIQMAGPSVIIAFVLAAIGTYIVYDALARMSSDHPEKGSFRTYAKKAFGRWVGFGSGWVYWSSELFIMGSQLTALSIFSRFWFPSIPLWIFASGYAVLGIGVVLLGTKGFERMENIFAVVKVAAIVMFLIIAIAALFGMFGGSFKDFQLPNDVQGYFPNGYKGLWSAIIFGFYAFGGIEIMGIMATRLKEPKEAPKSGKMMLLLLTIIYILSIGIAVSITSINKFNSKESPFIVALDRYDIAFVPHVFNGALIIAGFSTMVASLFAITSMLVTLAEDGDAPSIFAKKGKKLKVAPYAMGITTLGMVAAIILALLIPGKIYEYITTAASLMLLYNWLLTLITSSKLLKLSGFDQMKKNAGILLILIAVSGTIFDKTSRPGFFISLLFLIVITVVAFVMRKVLKKRHSFKPQRA
ncbi:amino acid permease [Bacillus massilinigeriensis]|uniref:amino acid permease n=1 Tax=Bacillus massilionigeriensis TaxID=1805475 RepID=UPI00096B1D6F|nr:amino acid permease [Bacillus massilionigeriensis]